MDTAVLLPIYSRGVGLVIQLMHQAVAVQQGAGERGMCIYPASISLEQDTGLWQQLTSEFPDGRPILLPDDHSLGTAAEKLLDTHERLVIHVQGNRQLCQVTRLRRQNPNRVKIVYTVHSFHNAQWSRFFYSFYAAILLRRNVDYTIFCSPAARYEFFGSGFVLDNGRGGQMVQGIEAWSADAIAEPPINAAPELLTTLGNDELFCFLYLTRVLSLKSGKQQAWLIKALAPVLRSHDSARLIIAGKSTPQVLSELDEFVEKLGIAGKVIFPGWIDRRTLAWVISRCKAGIVSSKSETFGHAYIEPMSLGKPVVGTRSGVASWMLMDYFTGIGFNYGDAEAMRRAAQYLLDNPDRAREMGQNAQELTCKLFTWKNVATSHLAIYETVWK